MKPGFTIIFLSLFLMSVTSLAQNWPRTFGVYHNAISNEMLEAYDKGYVIAGNQLKGDIMWNGYLIKTDINGFELWNMKLGRWVDHMWNILGVEQTKDNGLILMGGTDSLDIKYDPCVTKLNMCGEKEWCHIYSNPDDWDYGIKIREVTWGQGYIALFNYWGDDMANERVWLIRLDEFGEVMWHQVYAQNDSSIWNEDGFDVQVTSDSNFLVTGMCYYPEIPGNDTIYQRPYFILTDSAGQAIWELPWGVGNNFVGRAIRSVESADKIFFSCGNDTRWELPYGNSPVIIKTSRNGEAINYYRIYDSTYLGLASTITWFRDSTLAIGATYSMSWNSDTKTSIFKTDTLGNIIHKRDLLITDQTPQGTVTTFDGKVLLTGGFSLPPQMDKIYLWKFNNDLEFDSIYTRPYTYDSLCPHPIVSDTIDMQCDIITGLREPIQSPELCELKAYPNPATDHIVFELPAILSFTQSTSHFNVTTYYHKRDKKMVLEAYDLNGRKAFSQPVSNDLKEIEISVSKLHNGMYVFRLLYGGQVVGSVKIIKN